MGVYGVRDVIWLLAFGVTFTLAAVIQQSTVVNPTPQTYTSTVKVLEQTRDRVQFQATERIVPKVTPTEVSEASNRNEKAQTNATAIGESIKLVASQLLHSNKTPPPPTSGEKGVVTDTRTPPFMKNQQAHKGKPASKPNTKIDEPKKIENSHAGIAFPVTHEEVEKEIELKIQTTKRKPVVKETSTTGEGLSTWVLVNGKPTPTTNKPEIKEKNSTVVKGETITTPEKDTKKPQQNRPKPARPVVSQQIKPIFVRKPVLISSNKSDLIAGGSAINEKEMNKIKASVLANVEKNAALSKTTTPGEIIVSVTTENVDKLENKAKETSKEIMVKINQVNLKNRKKSETKEKPALKENSVTKTNDENERVESKIAEIELPVSTPPPSPKIKSKKKKNKNRRRKPAIATETDSSTKLENKNDGVKDKVNKKVKVNKTEQNDTNIYNFISRKVIPSVGIGLVSLAGLFGIASYFFNPFATLRRSDNLIERKDIYHYNDEQYADDGGQREEDVLGNLFPDVPVDNKIQNPVVQQNPNRYSVNPTQFTYGRPMAVPSTTENIRYRNSGYGADTANFISNDRIGPKSPDIIQGSAYSENIHYDTHSTGNREPYAVYPQPQPVYKAPDRKVDNAEYGADVYHSMSSYTPHQLSDSAYAQPLRYNQEMFEATSSPISNVHINDEDVIEHQKETGYTVDALTMDNDQEPQFVVGNVPKELIQATPVTVPEHGPRSLKIRRKRDSGKSGEPKIESAAESLKRILDTAQKEDNSMSNEIDDDIIIFKGDKQQQIIPNTYMTSYRNETIKMDSSEDSSVETSSATTDSKVSANATAAVEDADETTASNSYTDDYPYNNNNDQRYPIVDFFRGLLDFKLKLGISILKATSDNLARYLKDLENNFNITTPQLRSRYR